MSLSNTAYHPNTLDLSVTASSASDDELNFLLHATGCYISNINANADAPNTNALFICFIVPQHAHGTLRNNFHKYPRTHNMVSIAIYMFSNYIPCMVASKLVYHWYGRSMQPTSMPQHCHAFEHHYHSFGQHTTMERCVCVQSNSILKVVPNHSQYHTPPLLFEPRFPWGSVQLSCVLSHHDTYIL